MLSRHALLAALTLAGTSSGGPVEKKCQPDAVQFGTDACFWSDSSHDYSWWQAAEACRSREMELASLHSQAENDFIQDLVTSESWIGLCNCFGNKFKWSDGTTLDFLNWNTGQPNGGDDACVWLGRNSGRWFDDSCSLLRGVVCKGPLHYVLD